jgi:hypothetical protein
LKGEIKVNFPVPPGQVTMKEWNIVVIEYNEDVIEKFLGLDTQTGHYRISSKIQNYDPVTNTGRTLSGSCYQFVDKPGKLHFTANVVYEQLLNASGVKVSLKFPEEYNV